MVVRRIMISSLKKCWQNTKTMPFVLRSFCQGGMVAGPVLATFVVVPITNWNVNGVEMTYRQVWSSGAGLFALLFTGLLSISAWGMAAKLAWSRWASVLAPLLPIAAFPQAMIGDLNMLLLNAAITSATAYFCLFQLKSVTRYFQVNENPRA